MKKLFLIATVALLSTSAAFACDGKDKMACKKGEKKECCKGKECKHDASKTTSTKSTTPVKKA